jgi:hypothetical protein
MTEPRRTWLAFAGFLLAATILRQFVPAGPLPVLAVIVVLGVAAVFRPGSLAPVMAASIIIILFSTPVLSTWKQLAKSGIAAAAGFQRIGSEITTPGAGLEVLPSRVREMRSMAVRNKLPSYVLSPGVHDDDTYMQVVESCWPIRYRKDSPYCFFLRNETPGAGDWVDIDRGEEVRLAARR